MVELTVTKSTFFNRYQFWILLLLAAFLRSIPLISTPFNWLESYFHEISHGIAAIVSGGEIVRIQLFLNGAGLCTSLGGSRLLTSFMGYAGAVFWGALIYRLASLHLMIARIVCGLVILLLIASCLLWTSDLLTLFILVILILLFLLKFKLADNQFLQSTMQFSGLVVVLNALMSPFYLVDGRAIGDGATLAELTLIPEIVWVGLWAAIAFMSLVWLAKSHQKRAIKG